MISLKVDKLRKRFGSVVALDDVSFEVGEGEIVALVGPSGGGKSTLLRAIAGLEPLDSGTVHLAGQAANHLSPQHRQVGFVFQHYALFRHMTVLENVEFGMKIQGVQKDERRRRALELMKMVGIGGLEQRAPTELSGGQRQRVALARALAPRPRLLLLDEPFSSVDARVREDLRRWLLELHGELKTTLVFVTHDQNEAFGIADRVVLVHEGRLQQIGTPRELLQEPISEFVASFIGDVNLLTMEIRGGHAVAGALSLPCEGYAEGARVRMMVRAHHLRLRPSPNGIASVTRSVLLGDRTRVDLDIAGAGRVYAHLPVDEANPQTLQSGQRVDVEVVQFRAFVAPR
jgi:sulfate transport system ATP-binding protein